MEPEELRLLDAFAYLMMLTGCVCFALLLRLSSPYGRYASQWPGPRVPARVAWALQELPALAWPLLECTCASPQRLDRLPNRVLLAMYLVHYVHRSLIFPFLIRGGKPMPLVTCVLAFLFCTCNGYLQTRYLSWYAVYAEDWVTQPCFLAGFALWLTGMLINIQSDHILRNLRKPEETGYKIPRAQQLCAVLRSPGQNSGHWCAVIGQGRKGEVTESIEEERPTGAETRGPSALREGQIKHLHGRLVRIHNCGQLPWGSCGVVRLCTGQLLSAEWGFCAIHIDRFTPQSKTASPVVP
ncbi:3-oxo-5-alpha-steroid 4-dehydrogenase 1 isoform X1 [Heterocephalus glaber]|uniref:3-oxo-5-alpha-steroid 4-dehydrogenase 1 isoform X1 n=1 Tax=Heterocephalus glaber TaxID=10181 RepID=A0AAX6T0P5_HETGA|nr:3-oxo-5-alpha-steroid 4-dehydrogenase 1 isoform X1 [Heterocephalus glaber]